MSNDFGFYVTKLLSLPALRDENLSAYDIAKMFWNCALDEAAGEVQRRYPKDGYVASAIYRMREHK